MVGGGSGSSTTTSKLKRAAKKIFQPCGSFSRNQTHVDPLVLDSTIISGSANNSPKVIRKDDSDQINFEGTLANDDSSNTTPSSSSSSSKNLCAICLDALSFSTGTSPGQAIFTAQCSHSFHFDCISSNVRHGGVTCPICRAHWTHLPRNLKIPACTSLYGNQTDDPILQILDNSIATFRVHRRSFLRSARYDDDDPIEPTHDANHPRLHLYLLSEQLSSPSFYPCLHGSSMCHLCGTSSQQQFNGSSSESINKSYLCVRLAHQPAIDLVLVASPNGPHLRLIKQSMALVVFSLRPIDRLAIVTYSSAAARIFPLRRMTSYGKRAASQVIDRLFYMGQADPFEGLKKGVKVLGDRAYENPQSCILHLSDSPTRSYHGFDMEVPVQIHRFHVGFSFGTSSGFVMHEFEQFLARVLGDAVRDVQLRIGEEGRIVRLGELRGGEERKIPLNVCEPGGHICVEYSYVEDGVDECIQKGEIIVQGSGGSGDKRETVDGGGADVVVDASGGRTSNAGNWDYHDPYMARRWAKHLHGYRL